MRQTLSGKIMSLPFEEYDFKIFNLANHQSVANGTPFTNIIRSNGYVVGPQPVAPGPGIPIVIKPPTDKPTPPSLQLPVPPPTMPPPPPPPPPTRPPSPTNPGNPNGSGSPRGFKAAFHQTVGAVTNSGTVDGMIEQSADGVTWTVLYYFPADQTAGSSQSIVLLITQEYVRYTATVNGATGTAKVSCTMLA